MLARGTCIRRLELLSELPAQHWRRQISVAISCPTFEYQPCGQATESFVVTLPGTTSAFAAANIYARATGYIEERYADIGDQVKAGQPLAKIIARELDDQIAQAEATLAQNKAAVQQVQANLDLARVTWARDKPLVDKGWTTPQQGSIDVQRHQGAGGKPGRRTGQRGRARGPARVLNQQKAYQNVVAPFDGVITQRNVDAGSWCRPMQPAALSCSRSCEAT